jgi:hypothetical protein
MQAGVKQMVHYNRAVCQMAHYNRAVCQMAHYNSGVSHMRVARHIYRHSVGKLLQRDTNVSQAMRQETDCYKHGNMF